MGVIVGDYFGISIERPFPGFPSNPPVDPTLFRLSGGHDLKTVGAIVSR